MRLEIMMDNGVLIVLPPVFGESTDVSFLLKLLEETLESTSLLYLECKNHFDKTQPIQRQEVKDSNLQVTAPIIFNAISKRQGIIG